MSATPDWAPERIHIDNLPYEQHWIPSEGRQVAGRAEYVRADLLHLAEQALKVALQQRDEAREAAVEALLPSERIKISRERREGRFSAPAEEGVRHYYFVPTAASEDAEGYYLGTAFDGSPFKCKLPTDFLGRGSVYKVLHA